MGKCCIIYNEPLPGALEDELDVMDQVVHVEQGLKDLGYVVTRKGFTDNFIEEMKELVLQKPDFVYNLVESINNKGELNYFIPALLNLNGIPYAGNSHESIFLTTSKVLSSKMMKLAGIPNPECFFPSQSAMLVPGKKYILKPVWEDGSMGITAESVFVCSPGYEERLVNLSDSHWFLEEYIDGREFNMSVFSGPRGPEVLPLAEIVFRSWDDSRPRIIDYKAKWVEDTFEFENTVRDFPGEKLEPDLAMKLRKVTTDCWKLFGLKGYARVDARVDKNNNVYVIEVNANPCIQPNGGFMAATREGGYEFTEVLQRIIADLNL